MSVKEGDRIRVTEPQDPYDDYEAGDTAVVTRVNSLGDVDVRWEEPRFADDDREAKRCKFLYDGEFVVIPSAGEILARIVKEADTHPFSPIGHVIEHVVPEARADAPAPSADGIALIAAERRRQIEDEGWTPEHDDEYGAEEMAKAAAVYAIPRDERLPIFWNLWPWHDSWWKPGDRIRELVKAGALIAAEIDRLQRAAAQEPQS